MFSAQLILKKITGLCCLKTKAAIVAGRNRDTASKRPSSLPSISSCLILLNSGQHFRTCDAEQTNITYRNQSPATVK